MLAVHAFGCWHTALGAGMLYNREKMILVNVNLVNTRWCKDKFGKCIFIKDYVRGIRSGVKTSLVYVLFGKDEL